jgi:FAD/FMN-containing dehydrogenase
MAADQILAIEAVTASGHFVTVTESSNKDLFWALRGGGGGAFAIATSVTIRVYPKVPATISAFSFALAGNITEATFFAGIRAYWGHFIRFADAGTWSHFWLTNSSTGVSFAIEPFYAPYHTVDKFNELLQPFFDELKILGIPITVNTTYTEEFLSGFGSVGLVDFGGGTLRAGLRIFPRKNWEDEQKLDETFEAMMLGMRAGGFSLGWTIAPRQVAGTENSVAPFWRTAVAIVNAGIPVADNATVEEVEEGSRQLEQILDQWRAVAPNSEGGGVYLNEADPEEPDWQHSFYGTAYERLLEIKHQVDPWGVFYGLTAVGSEEWEVYDGDRGIQTQDGRLCRK